MPVRIRKVLLIGLVLLLTLSSGCSADEVWTDAVFFKEITVDNLIAAVGRTATYVVAASDAPALIKAQADIVVVGNADDEIQLAITTVNTSGGGKVYLTEGLYPISDTINLCSNITLQGAGKHLTKLRLNDNTAHTILYLNNVSRITISDIEIDGNKDNNTWNSGGGYEWGQNGILNRYGGSEIIIRDSYIHDTWTMGIMFASTQNSFVVDNIFKNCPLCGLELAGANNTIVKGNLFVDCGQTAAGPSGAQAAFESYNMLNSVFSNNILVNSAFYAFLARNGMYNSIVANNIIYGAIVGITAQGATDPFSQNIIEGNVIKASNTGIKIEGSATAQYNIISNNLFVPIEIGQYFTNYGIELGAQSSYNKIVNNSFHTVRGYVLYLHGTGHNLVANNSIVDCAWDSSPDAAGIYLESTEQNNKVIGNYIFNSTDAMKYGIIEAVGATNNVFEGNFIQGWATSPATFEGTNTVVRSNQGYISENSSKATMVNGNSSLTVNHGLSANATAVQLTGTHAEVKDCIVTNITSTQFTITASSNVTANRDIYWRATVGEGN